MLFRLNMIYNNIIYLFNWRHQISISQKQKFKMPSNWPIIYQFIYILLQQQFIKFKLRMKSAIYFAIDAGASMNKSFSEDMTRTGLAFQCVKYTLQQQLFLGTNTEIGIYLFGQDEADDGHHQLIQQLSKPNLKLVRDIQKMRLMVLQNSREGGDLFRAIQYGVDKIVSHCGTKKYVKRIFLFTNGTGKSNYTEPQVQKLIKDISRYQIKLNIIAIDFMEDYNHQDNKIEGYTYINNDQQSNSRLLIRMRQIAPESLQIIPAVIAVDLYRQFRKKQVNPVACFRGQMVLAPGFFMEVATYKKVRQQKIKSLKKYNLKQNFSPNQKQGLVQNDVLFQVHDDPTGQIVSPQYQVKGYQYGRNIIPISQALEGKSKILQQKCLKLLGFVAKQKIPRHALMSSMDIVIPGQDVSSRKLFTSLVFSMLTLNRYALARYIPRNMKNGVSPKLMVLIPYRSGTNQCFYMTQLPTAEDVRDYQFRSLKPATQTQKSLISKLVQKMNLMNNSDGKPQQQLIIKNMFNPTIQRFYQVVFHRAFNPTDQIPPLDSAIQKYLNPQTDIYERTRNVCELIKKQFGLVKKQIAKEKQEIKIVWKDLIQNSKPQLSIASQSTDIDDIPVGKKFTMQQEQILHVDPKNPIQTFNKMINNQYKDLVNPAISQFSDIIYKKVMNSYNDQAFKMSLGLLDVLRQGCISQKEQKNWDDFLEKCFEKFPEKMRQLIRESGLGFIKRDNRTIFNTSELTKLVQQIEVDDLD